MTSTDTMGTPAAATAEDAQQPSAGGGWHWLDAAGIIAGLILAVIVVDVWTDGRLISRRLTKRGQEVPEDAPPVAE